MNTELSVPQKKVSREELKQYFKDVYKLADEQVAVMLESSAKSLNSSLTGLYKALEDDGNHEETSRLAHSMKGLLLNMGQAEWSDVAKDLELNAVTFDQKKSLALVRALHRGVEELL